jgi:tetratricopeptide (TPR) repeat protein
MTDSKKIFIIWGFIVIIFVSFLIILRINRGTIISYMDETSAESYLAEGKKYFDNEQYEKALESYKKVEEIMNKTTYYNPWVFQIIGVSYLKLGDYENALKYLKRFTDENKESIWAFMNLALCYMHFQRVDEAEKAYLEGLKIDENNIAVRENLAGFYLEQEKYDKAIEQLEELIVLEPLAEKIYVKLGSAYEKINNLAKVKDVLSKLIVLNNKNSDYRFQYAKALFQLGEYNDSVREFSEAIRWGNKDPVINKWIGLCYYRTKQFPQAKDSFKKYLENNPKDDEIKKLFDEIVKESK